MDGTRTHIWYCPSSQRGAVFLSNGDAEYSAITDVIMSLLVADGIV